MLKHNYNVLGVMSGTSLDGVDLAHIQFTIQNNHWHFVILQTQTVPYTTNWQKKLQVAVNFSAQDLQDLNYSYTQLLGSIINNFIQTHQIQNLDAVCSHGHTVLHQPHNKITLQIGNLAQIAQYTNQTVVCDFRVQDVQMGGQGAPLVPIGDEILFNNFDYCLNLGGFSNLSFDNNNQRIAFDISPVNTVLNYYANQLGFAYDDKGAISRTGGICTELLDQLNKIDFYKKKHPKSLGFESVTTIFIPLIEQFSIPIANKMQTFVTHVAQQIAKALPQPKGKMLVTGGGAYNDYLIQQMQAYLPEVQIIIPEPKIIEFKEALIFGLLGVLRLENQTNVLASVTGATHNHSAGKIWKP